VSRTAVLTLKVSKAGGSAEASWMVNDRTGSIRRFVLPEEASSLVRREMAGRRCGYFYAVQDGAGRIIWGSTAGNQAW
jgi:hypothetical protein